MTYEDIQGWFDFQALYDRIVAAAHGGDTFIEIGAWLGKSTAYMGQRIKESGKAVTFYAVDTWQGSASEPDQLKAGAESDLYLTFLANMNACGLGDVVLPVRMNSLDAALRLPPAEFIFLDADHSYDAVMADLKAWLPKVKPGGTFAGHDWNSSDGVPRAVRALLPTRHHIEGNCWVVNVPR